MNATASRSTAPTARVGNYGIWKISASAYVLRGLDGTDVGTFSTARAANTAAIALITASYKASKRG